jgi:hypothetical protein
MLIADRHKIYTKEEIGEIENQLLQETLACGSQAAVEACITYARFLNLTGLSNENYPLFIKVLEVGNHWVIDALIGDRDPFLFLSSIQPNPKILASCMKILTEKHPGELYPKSLSVILGVFQATYNVPEDGYNMNPLSIYDLNTIGKHLNEEIGQEDSLNRVIMDILFKIAQLRPNFADHAVAPDDLEKEKLAIHANDIMNHFFDDTKRLIQVIPSVLLIQKDYRTSEISPRREVAFEDSKIYEAQRALEQQYGEDDEGMGEAYDDEVYDEETYQEEFSEDDSPEKTPQDDLEPEPA